MKTYIPLNGLSGVAIAVLPSIICIQLTFSDGLGRGWGGIKKTSFAKEAFGDPGGARTLDPLIKSQLLYQLSYGVMMFIRFRIASAKLRQFLKPAKKICVFFKKSAFFVVFLVFSPSCASVLCVFGPEFG